MAIRKNGGSRSFESRFFALGIYKLRELGAELGLAGPINSRLRLPLDT